MSHNESDSKPSLLLDSRKFFSEMVTSALEKRRLETTPLVQQYLIGLLESYVSSGNLGSNQMLSEQLLLANQSEKTVRREMLKRLGDSSLYISGFFGDSLKRKIIDIDYYADIGGIAYSQLAKEFDSDLQSRVFNEFASRFLDYVDLLTYISQNSLVQSNQDLLRLYERYVKTGSEFAKEQLLEKGLLTTEQAKKATNQ
jgi:hypothetical protein